MSFRDLQKGLRNLGLAQESRLLALVSLSALGEVHGGAEAVAGALATLCQLVVAPAFTPQCQVWPRVGPEGNGMRYGDDEGRSAQAEFFQPDLPAHPDLGPVTEAVRCLKGAQRSAHPLLSFAAIGQGAEKAAAAQSMAEPLGPIAHLAEQDGVVLLLGLDQRANVAIHYAEYRAGRKQFIRWALTPRGVVECLAYPGCPDGFEALAPRLQGIGRSTRIGPALAQCFPLRELLSAAEALIRADPLALLCQRAGCERCDAVRAAAGARLAQ